MTLPSTVTPPELAWVLAYALALGFGVWCEYQARLDAAADLRVGQPQSPEGVARRIVARENVARERGRLFKVTMLLLGGVILCVAPNGPVSDLRNWESWAFYTCMLLAAAGFVVNSWRDLVARRRVYALRPSGECDE